MRLQWFVFCWPYWKFQAKPTSCLCLRNKYYYKLMKKPLYPTDRREFTYNRGMQCLSVTIGAKRSHTEQGIQNIHRVSGSQTMSRRQFDKRSFVSVGNFRYFMMVYDCGYFVWQMANTITSYQLNIGMERRCNRRSLAFAVCRTAQ